MARAAQLGVIENQTETNDQISPNPGLFFQSKTEIKFKLTTKNV